MQAKQNCKYWEHKMSKTKKYQWKRKRKEENGSETNEGVQEQDSGRYREIQRLRDWWGVLPDRGSMLLPGAPLPGGVNGCGGPTGARRGPSVCECVRQRVKENNLIVSPLHCSHQHTTINHCQTQQPMHTNTRNTETHARTNSRSRPLTLKVCLPAQGREYPTSGSWINCRSLSLVTQYRWKQSRQITWRSAHWNTSTGVLEDTQRHESHWQYKSALRKTLLASNNK